MGIAALGGGCWSCMMEGYPRWRWWHWCRCLVTSPTIDDDGAPQHPVYHIAAADQKRAYPTAVSIGVTARMIWEVCGLTVAIEERRRRFYNGRYHRRRSYRATAGVVWATSARRSNWAAERTSFGCTANCPVIVRGMAPCCKWKSGARQVWVVWIEII